MFFKKIKNNILLTLIFTLLIKIDIYNPMWYNTQE